ncbi:hypothetical protein ILYODFUR_008266 [Ilyodon furcidens]|uniref:Uncharacterized protein n=1 Tax=Ilyodon furcidens TaxID=33524 RepID=A0ABV0UTX9_9TELE
MTPPTHRRRIRQGGLCNPYSSISPLLSLLLLTLFLLYLIGVDQAHSAPPSGPLAALHFSPLPPLVCTVCKNWTSLTFFFLPQFMSVLAIRESCKITIEDKYTVLINTCMINNEEKNQSQSGGNGTWFVCICFSLPTGAETECLHFSIVVEHQLQASR